jgi:hypothetical protein
MPIVEEYTPVLVLPLAKRTVSRCHDFEHMSTVDIAAAHSPRLTRPADCG